MYSFLYKKKLYESASSHLFEFFVKQETVTHSYPLMKIILNREVNNHFFLSLEYAGRHYNMGQLG